MAEPLEDVLARVAEGALPSDAEAHRLAREASIDALREAAAARRDRFARGTLTFSPKVFLPLTNLCRNRCDYCSFRRSPGEAGEWTMSPDEVRAFLDQGRAQGCVEALFCLGDTPETGFRDYHALLRSYGHASTVEYLEWAGEEALARGLLPHTNAGILTREAMARLRRVNVSLGLMLENVSDRLCERGMPHHKAPDKRPAKRIRMTAEAGELAIPFTSGLLIGIGETLGERVDTLLEIRRLHGGHGHIQEIIVQNFRARPGIAMADAPEPNEDDVVRAIALARLLLPDEVSVQAPPNLNAASIERLVGAGLDDFGGISPVTPDFINPRHPWPHLEALASRCAALGHRLRPRLPIYERFVARGAFVDAALRPKIEAAAERLGGARGLSDLGRAPGTDVLAGEARP